MEWGRGTIRFMCKFTSNLQIPQQDPFLVLTSGAARSDEWNTFHLLVHICTLQQSWKTRK